MERNDRDKRKTKNIPSGRSTSESQSFLSRLFKAVTGQAEPAERKPPEIEVGCEARTLLEGNSEATRRTFLNSGSRLKVYFSKKSFSIDEGLKQFWMPDSSAGACYECSEPFTAIRRGHHCGICGEIFCSRCCDRIVQGRVFGFTGEIRSCEFCCKVLVSGICAGRLTPELAFSMPELRRNLKLFNFDILKFEKDFSTSNKELSAQPTIQPKAYVLPEEDYIPQLTKSETQSTDIEHQERLNFEKKLMYRDDEALQELRSLMVYGSNPLPMDTRWHHMRSVSNCFTGKGLVCWLMEKGIASRSDYANVIAQVLMLKGYMIGASLRDWGFTPDCSIYVICPLTGVDEPDRPVPRELSNWCMAAKDYSSELMAEYRKEMHPDSDQEDVESDKEQNKKKRSRKCPKLDSKRSPKKSIASLCPSYYLNKTPEKDEIKPSQRSDSLDTDDSQDDSKSSGAIVKPSALDEVSDNQIVYETEEDACQFRECARVIWDTYERKLLTQLIEYADISDEWIDVIRNLSHVVCHIVMLDVKKYEGQMDLRRFVKFKKVLADGDRQAEVIDGVVCTKNVLQRGMKTHYVSPRILLIENSVDFPNSGERYISLKTVMEQEPSYLKNVCDKIIALCPNIVMIGNQIANKALTQLMDSGITVIANIKKSVMQRVARVTETQIVVSVDSMQGYHVLGTCNSFYLNTYADCAYNRDKVLMFFDGCPTNLDCTVILKGHNYDELHHAKRIAYLMLLAVHNFIRETSFLREISASLLPMLEIPDQIISNLRTPSPQGGLDDTKDASSAVSSTDRFAEIGGVGGTEPTGRSPKSAKTKGEFIDPLQSYLESGDRAPDPSASPDEYDFASCLSKVVLSMSPYYKFQAPYLESAIGKKSPLIKYFTPKQLSSHLFAASKPKKVLKKPPPLPTSCIKTTNKPIHPLVMTNITKPVDDEEIADLFADFRACGGQVELNYLAGTDNEPKCRRSYEKKSEKTPAYKLPLLTIDKQVDALHPFNHQSICLLYCSFCEDFEETSKFCVDPCFLQIDFFARNDITLGRFLEQYCFSSGYTCPSTNCSSPARNHVRKFSHASGCVEIMMRMAEPAPPTVGDDNIYIWSWCRTCERYVQYDRQPISDEVYNYSFAKYLELRFYQDKISKRGDRRCPHSMNQESFHYFKKRTTTAIVRYRPEDLRELVVPPAELPYTLLPLHHSLLVEQFKGLTNQGTSVFTAGFEEQQKLADIAGANLEPIIKSLVADQVKHRLLYKEKQNNIQAQLNDEEFANRIDEEIYTEADVKRMYLIRDDIVNCKVLLMKVITDWNAKIQEFLQIKKKDEKAKQPAVHTRSTPESATTQASEEVGAIGGRTTEQKQEGQHLCVDESQFSDFSRIPEEAQDFNKEQSIITDLIQRLKSLTRPIELPPLIHSPPSPASSVLKLLHSSSAAEYFTSSRSKRDVGGGLEKSDVQHPKMFKRSFSAKLTDIAESSAEVVAHAASAPIKPAVTFGRMETPEIPIDSTDSPERKSSVKQLISSLWNSPLDSLIRSPFYASEHYGVLPHVKVPIAIVEAVPSSFIAHCLASKKYDSELKFLQRQMSADLPGQGGPQPRPLCDRVHNHIELQFKDQTADFSIKIFFADHFRRLRSIIFPHGEDVYIRCLARCLPWEAKGGKSGSGFLKTADDRLVLKDLSKSEALSFEEFGPAYISYVVQCQRTQQPTVLAKILGVYYINIKNNATNKNISRTYLVLENLFYKRKISHKFDLKGSIGNRMVSISTNPEDEIVLMDRNLVKMACSSPLFLREHSKEVLTRAVESDTNFLCNQFVMDYSLLVGVDEEQNELVVGIIDYIRVYTLDKKLESILKLSLNPKQSPTVVRPEAYRMRFCKAMNKYFLCMPDRWFQFGTKFKSGKL